MNLVPKFVFVLYVLYVLSQVHCHVDSCRGIRWLSMSRFNCSACLVSCLFELFFLPFGCSVVIAVLSLLTMLEMAIAFLGLNGVRNCLSMSLTVTLLSGPLLFVVSEKHGPF